MASSSDIKPYSPQKNKRITGIHLNPKQKLESSYGQHFYGDWQPQLKQCSVLPFLQWQPFGRLPKPNRDYQSMAGNVMTPKRWLQIKSLFHDVLDQPINQRQVFLEEACREDIDLRQEVESLLQCANQIEDDFLAPIEPNSGTRTPTRTDTLNEKTTPGKAELAPGEVIRSRYQIERELGRGGFSIVYLARETLYQAAGGPPITRPVVIKCLLSETIQSAWHHQKFQHEIEALSAIDHPGVVGLLEVGQLATGQPFLVMPFINGTTLRSVIKPPGMETAQAIQLIRHLCNALAAVHAKGIIHRDLKPENVMLMTTQNGEAQAKLIDFGIAKLSVSQIGATTQQPFGAGTLKYMAPEQLLDGITSPQSDIFALGIIVFEILTGRRPFDSKAATPLFGKQGTVRTAPEGTTAIPGRAPPGPSPRCFGSGQPSFGSIKYGPLGHRRGFSNQFGNGICQRAFQTGITFAFNRRNFADAHGEIR